MKVFWSWQSDTPGKIGRHFIRDALQLAIDELKQSTDLDEPTAAATREKMYLDHDREGDREVRRLQRRFSKRSMQQWYSWPM
jgi:hypothetical protein